MSEVSRYAAAAAVLGGAAGVMAYAVRGRSSSLLAPSVYHGARDRRSIALTFDDGPSESTPDLLNLLEKFGVRATFFQCGANVRRLPSISREVLAAGHEVGNHSDSHPRLYFKNGSFIARELSSAQETIAAITGSAPRFFRAPYGVRWFGLREAQRRLDLLGVMWTTIGVDWKLPVNPVVTRLLQGAGNGAILCLHDGRILEKRPNIRVTLEAVNQIVPKLIDRGFHFETISEILCPTKNSQTE
ncbi:MAG TPA: polysaccharide deacetylase family protein [Bryobacteraceae bacterium]|nr:polysaccharide deacetylase family protein [Bryobacteraceae bacterium]